MPIKVCTQHQSHCTLSAIIVIWYLAYLAVPTTQAQLRWSEIYASPIKEENEWYEVYNESEQDLDISHYQLAKAGVKINIKPLSSEMGVPLIIPAKSYLVLQSSIVLPNAGGKLYLYDQQGKLIDELAYPRLKNGQSYARLPDKNPVWQITTLPTPGAVNQCSLCIALNNPDNKESSQSVQLIADKQQETTPSTHSALLSASGSGNLNQASLSALASKQKNCLACLTTQQQSSKNNLNKATSPNNRQSKNKQNNKNNHRTISKTTNSKTNPSAVSKNTTTAQPISPPVTTAKLAVNPMQEHEPHQQKRQLIENRIAANLPTAAEKKLPLPILSIESAENIYQEIPGSTSALVTKDELAITKQTNKLPAPLLGVFSVAAIISGIIICRLKQQADILPIYEQKYFSTEKI